MGYTAPNLLVRIHGSFASSISPIGWSTGLRLPAGSLPTDASIASFLADIATDVTALHSTMQAGTGTYVRKLTGALVGVDGKYHFGALAPTVEYIYPTPIASTGSYNHPWATATVLTLRTDLLRGRASHGRMFWPAVGVQISGTTGLIDAAVCQDMANAGAAFLRAVNTAGGAIGVGPVSVMSFIGAGTTSTVRRVGVGRVPDHQERRENVLDEDYVYANV